MPARQVARFPLVGGMDTKSDEKHVPVPKLEIAKNVDLSTPGAIVKRRALKADGAGSLATLLGGGRRYHVDPGVGGAYAAEGGYAKALGASGASDQELLIGAPSITTAETFYSEVDAEFPVTQMAMYGGELHCLVVGSASGLGFEPKMIVLDPDTLERLNGTDDTGFPGNAGMGGAQCRLLPVSNGVVAVWGHDISNELRAQVYRDGEWQGSAVALVTGVHSLAASSIFDAVVNAAGDKIWVAAANAAVTATLVYGFDYNGTTFSVMASSQSEALVGVVALAQTDLGLGDIVLSVASTAGTHELFEYSADLATRWYGFVLDAATGAAVVNTAVHVYSANKLLVWVAEAGNVVEHVFHRPVTRVIDSTRTYQGALIAHRPIAMDGGVAIGLRRQLDDGAPVYVTMWLRDPSDSYNTPHPIATYAHGGLAMEDAHGSTAGNECSIVAHTTALGTKWIWGGGLRHSVRLTDGGADIVSNHGAGVLTMELATPKMYGHAFGHDALIVAGSVPAAIVGGRVLDAGYLHRPRISATANGTAGSMAGGTTHSLIAVYETTDDLGRVWRSAPSAAVSHALGGGSSSITVTADTPIKAAGADYAAPAPRLAIYMTVAGGTGVYYRATPAIDAGAAGSFVGPVSGATSVCTLSDADLATSEVLYTDAGELSHAAPPPCAVIVQHKNRFAAIHSETGDIWLSLEFVRGEGVHWSPVLSIINGSASDKPTALVSTESALVVFYRDRVGYIYGDGPNNQGLGQGFTTVQFLPDADVGAISQQTVAKLPMGIFFCDGDKGWHVLPYGGGAAQYVGMDMDGPPTEVIVGTAHLPERQEVRAVFYNAETYGLESASWVTWHYGTGQWSIGYAADHDTAVPYAMADGNEFLIDGVGEDPGAGLDGASTYVEMRVRTGWIAMQEATRKQGLHRLWTLYMLAEALDEHDLAVEVFYDYDLATGSTELLLEERAAGAQEGVRIDPGKQLIEAFKLDIIDEVSAGLTGEGIRLTDLEMHFGVYPGVKPRRGSAGRMVAQ